eukprot:comp17922_c0_seq1/m.31113 comp17922_c0_seq1/g.31113  ORF comp17922_c0_seq1/g.31113 comp17922_c0_seq1/m.31113 type:complete len:209 (+) comp17922_c0_seq1:37-663(+)
MSKKLEEQLFELKFAAKQLQRQSKKLEKDEKEEKLKVKKCIEKGNSDGAKIHAQNSIRFKNQSMNTLKLASRVDAVAGRLENAIRMGQVSAAMSKIVSTMGSALGSLDLQKISSSMEAFDKTFENIDIASATIEDSMAQSSASLTPEDQVSELIMKVADEHSLQLKGELEEFAVSKKTPVSESASKDKEPAEEEDDLMARLAKLKANN